MALLALLYLDLESGDGFDGIGMITILIYLVFFCASLVFFANAIRKKNIQWVSIGILALFLPVIAIYIGNRVSNTKAQTSRGSAQSIITALEEYGVKSNNYPEDLESLVPKTIDQIPHHSMGIFRYRVFRYQIDSLNEEFVLSFPHPFTYGWSYFSSTQSWLFD